MKKFVSVAFALALFAPAAVAHAQGAAGTFSITAGRVAGFPTGAVSLVGGGSFDLASGVSRAGGGFSVLEDVHQGPLAGAVFGQGVRWDVDHVLPSTTFKCTGAASEALKTAFTDAHTVCLLADFYRAGDGIHESFQANMIVSDHDLDPALPGNQNVWVQGVGCAEARVEFR